MTKPSDRLIYIDALRGLAILLMVQDHAFDWWLRAEFHPTPWGRVTEFFGTFAAPLFLFLMGVSLALSAEKRLQRGVPVHQLAIAQLRRGLFLVLTGYALTWLTFYNGHNLAEMSAVDVLHCLGLSMMILTPLTLLRASPVTLSVTLVVAVVSPWAGSWDLSPRLGAWLNGIGGVSYFPLFPFMTYALAGLTTGQLLARTLDRPYVSRRLMLALVPTGLSLFLLVPLVPPDLGTRFPGPVFMLFSLTVILWVLALTYALARWPAVLRPLAKLGRAAMMVYVVHHLLGFRLFYLFGWVTGHSWQGQYGVFSPSAACLLLGVLLIVLYGLTGLWLVWQPRIGSTALVHRFAPALAAYW
jgi:peptidoglycan/LPS O-acetylase OafA/YrhL